jgi:hypothetical protein
MAWKDICALSLLSIAIIVAFPTASASNDSLSDLKATISGFDDPHMDAEDLAFFLASHGFDATPKGNFVEVDLNGHVHKLTPNGPAPGLAWIAAITC